jgi:hypothetical protein
VVATPDALDFNKAGLLKFYEDSLNRTNGEPHMVGDISHATIRVAGNADQYVGVI